MNKDEQNLSFLLDVALLKKLLVGIGEVSKVTGIPTRKIRYWEEKGIIQSEANRQGSNRRYDYLNIKKMLLIQEMLDEGYVLEAAAKKVDKRMLVLQETFDTLAKELIDHNTEQQDR